MLRSWIDRTSQAGQESPNGTQRLDEDQVAAAYRQYIYGFVHGWLKTLNLLGVTLVPIFFILDYFVMPHELLSRFALYRLTTTVIVLMLVLLTKYTRPSRFSLYQGYLFSIVVGGMIALMTTDLGGFNSTYYAGLNLVIMGVNLLVPWQAIHAAINSALVIGMYVLLNLLLPSSEPMITPYLINNMYFLTATALISVCITYLRFKLIRQEFLARHDLRAARDALWSEMEVAKQIQTSLLPQVHSTGDYQVAAIMIPADEVGGDYYDVITTRLGETWVTIGDVSGHGVESGLIMMMTQTSIFTTVNSTRGHQPSTVLERTNSIIKENIHRLGTDRYMTICVMLLQPEVIVYAGKHQDILIYRNATGTVEVQPTTGTWIGIVDDIDGFLSNQVLPIEQGDIILLYTDGVTEAMDSQGTMFGERRLQQALSRYAKLELEELVSGIVRDVKAHTERQEDDLTLVALRRG